jgi:hypothetical protein
MRATTVTWTNNSGGYWSNTNNWYPHQIPTNTDNTLIAAPGTYTVVFDLPSVVNNQVVPYASVVSNLTVGVGLNGSGTQTLLITNLTTTFGVVNCLMVTNGGVVTMTNGYLSTGPVGSPTGSSGSMIIAGGVFTGANLGFASEIVTLTSGGRLNSIYNNLAFQALSITNGGTLNSRDDTIAGPLSIYSGGAASVAGVTLYSFLVLPGGTLDLLPSAGAFYGVSLQVNAPSTNYGTINMTNGNLVAMNGYSLAGDAFGALVNGAGGIFNLSGSGGVDSESYLVNQGVMTQSSGTNFVIGLPLDSTSGTISNWSGVFTVGYVSNLLAGTFCAAPSATIQLEGMDLANNNTATQLALGSPLVLAGSGQFQLTSGYLYLSSNVPTNLQLMCDTVTLGPNFQGGTITNLTFTSRLVGSQGAQEDLLNTLPVTGTLVATDLAIVTNLVVNPGGVVTLNAQNPNFNTFPVPRRL